MPRRDDIHSILIIGSGPIIIGQACEFDYSGTQACKALREEGYRVILVNSNPATIMTDPEIADRTYIEPITWQAIEKIIVKERPDAVLPTLGGQTGLNAAIDLHEHGVLKKYGVQLLGAQIDVIRRAEDRQLFKDAMLEIGLDLPKSRVVRSLDEAMAALEDIGLPCILRPSFTMGGTGGGIAFNREEFREIAQLGIDLSPVHETLVEESVLGWKEYEVEVMRDHADNCVIVCTIENFDPMGVHTGDSITVAPIQTLTDREYQRMRDAAFACIRKIGVETGGSNIQFATDPKTGRMIVIEMNPRVSRSSALASKATGFPIAKIAAKLAVGYTLDEIGNDITRKTPACFEPSIDYVVVKIPRFAFEKFPDADSTLGSQMKSVGEAMAIGRTFKEALQKALRSTEEGRQGLGLDKKDLLARGGTIPRDELIGKLARPNSERIRWIRYAMKCGMSRDEIQRHTSIDPWFLVQLEQLVETEDELRAYSGIADVPTPLLRRAKREGFADAQFAYLFREDPMDVRAERIRRGVLPTYKLVDTCAAEFEAATPYYYSTWEDECEARVSDKKKIMILGSGPNRIGQGVEFDYCCCHAAFALRDAGFETIMVNSNPETVSTDYDTSDLLFFEPLTLEDVLNIHDRLKPWGTIVQFGGQTPLKLAQGLENAGVRIIGTSPHSIDLAEDREEFAKILDQVGLRQSPNGMASSLDDALNVTRRIGYPVLVRPSYVLGGRGMRICYDDQSIEQYVKSGVEIGEDRPVLLDRFLEDAIEVDVDAVSDGDRVVVAAVMEHIEEAGVHSGDSQCSIPPSTLSREMQAEIRRATVDLALALKVLGLMNVQYAIQKGVLYVLEVNPRASRTVPYVSKAIGHPIAKIAARVMAGATLDELGFIAAHVPVHNSVKGPVFPFNKFRGVDTVLGPEMQSTGEVMGIDADLGVAFAKSLMAAGVKMPYGGGTVFLSVRDSDKPTAVHIGRELVRLGYRIVSTHGTRNALLESGVDCDAVNKVQAGRPNVLDLLTDKKIDLIINTPSGRGPRTDEGRIRAAAVQHGIPCITTLSGAAAAIHAIERIRARGFDVKALQDYFVAPVG
ncbi:MAG: carbamoyl-phosphate synthase large subunit [Planctomycetes bacterium]|nr:carbamoyl-phosphate synthase large subunit [Planctomycetota bacterium]